MITFIICAVYFLALFTALEYSARKLQLPIELSRKLAHILAATSVAFLPYFVSFGYIVALAVLSFGIMLFSRWRHIFRSIHNVERQSYGELLFPIAIIIVAVLFPSPKVFTYAMLVMALADGLAGVLGSYFGRTTYKLGWTTKSYFGSAVFFIVSLLITLLFSDHTSVLMVAALLTLVEAASAKGLDNLFLPPVAAWLLTLVW